MLDQSVNLCQMFMPAQYCGMVQIRCRPSFVTWPTVWFFFSVWYVWTHEHEYYEHTSTLHLPFSYFEYFVKRIFLPFPKFHQLIDVGVWINSTLGQWDSLLSWRFCIFINSLFVLFCFFSNTSAIQLKYHSSRGEHC